MMGDLDDVGGDNDKYRELYQDGDCPEFSKTGHECYNFFFGMHVIMIWL